KPARPQYASFPSPPARALSRSFTTCSISSTPRRPRPTSSIAARSNPNGPPDRAASGKGISQVTQTPLSAYRRITIKIGSALLVDKSGKLRAEWLAQLAEDIAALKAEGREVVFVSSGAIALGRGLLGLS